MPPPFHSRPLPKTLDNIICARCPYAPSPPSAVFFPSPPFLAIFYCRPQRHSEKGREYILQKRLRPPHVSAVFRLLSGARSE